MTGLGGWQVAKTYLSLGDAKACSQLCSLWQREILGPLEPSLQLLDLQRGVYRAWLPDLLPLSIDSSDQLAMFYNTVSCNTQELHRGWVANSFAALDGGDRLLVWSRETVL